ncbi:sensor domain-containing phosphodiesterase [Dyella sp. A6]|uniref:putative bifunctional diguanylate cyclase/phosphodiesterase n=1 Tax=Dyella aluminiiresistens TaxID=3069105 RepID=UPI002E7A80BA|nr:sensor domain-containing phosphodiesterase [Dyella sp. A6]
MQTMPGHAPGSTLDESRPTSTPNDAESVHRFAVPGFDAVARLVARSLDVPLVTLVLGDGSAYWYSTTPNPPMLPAGAPAPGFLDAARSGVAEVVLDAREDARFQPAPPATGPVGFFASEPVMTLNGHPVGALCVMDRMPRQSLSTRERTALRDAAALAGTGVVLRSYMGRTDPVSQLPHRGAFFEDLRGQLRNAHDTVWLAAIEVAPVERFNAFIRAMGHVYADALVRAVAERVQIWMSADMCLYQVGTSRLAIMLPAAHERPSDAQLHALVRLLREPFDCLGIPLTLRPGVGLLQVESSEMRGGDPLRRVMSASHAAQDSASGWAMYEHDQDERHRQDFFLVTELAAALTDRTELDLYYQPRVDLESGQCVALEALLRWHHPTLGEVLPSRFVPLAERAGLMRALTEWVLDHGLARLAVWQAQGLAIKLSFNVSGADFDADFLERLETLLARHSVDPGLLELEFTESTLMHPCDATLQHLMRIRAMGIGIAIDDFGTGYSNLASLREMPATTLKIDQSLVRSIDGSRGDAATVRSVTALARELGFRVVVEGVENASVYAAVLDMACDEAQGFHIARPMPAAAVTPWLQAYAAAPFPSRRDRSDLPR